MLLDQMIKLISGEQWWAESPFADRRMINYRAHGDNWYSGEGQFPLRECKPIAFVWHEPQEPADNDEVTPRYFAQYHPATPGSTTYYNDTDGDVYQMVPLNRAPVANGLKGFPMPRFNDGGPEFGAYSLNQQTHNSEVEGYTHSIKQTMTQAQWWGCVDIAAVSMILYDWPRNPRRVGLAHGELATDRSDGLWIAKQSGIPQEATNLVLRIEADIKDLKRKQGELGLYVLRDAIRLNKLETHTVHPPK